MEALSKFINFYLHIYILFLITFYYRLICELYLRAANAYVPLKTFSMNIKILQSLSKNKCPLVLGKKEWRWNNREGKEREIQKRILKVTMKKKTPHALTN